MLTGKYIDEHMVRRLHDVLDASEVLFPSHLKDLGYTTALFGKLHVSGRLYEEAQRHPHDGFDQYEWCMEASVSMDSPFNGYSKWLKEKAPEFHAQLKTMGRKVKNIPKEFHFTHWAAERTIDFINKYDKDTPFFCMMSVFDPHNPYDDYPLEYRERVAIEKMAMPTVSEREKVQEIESLRREQLHGYLGNTDTFTEEDYKEMRIGYHASIALLDDEIGRVLQTLAERGYEQNTLIVFVSDHGDMLGDHGLVVKGAYFYDPCVRVPLILSYPGKIPAGIISEALVQPNDLASTILHAAGMEPEKITQLMPNSLNLLSHRERAHRFVVCSYRETGISDNGTYFNPPIYASMIFDGRYKLNLYHSLSEDFDATEGQLFDLQTDPEEQINLFSKDLVHRLKLMEMFAHWEFTMHKNRKDHQKSAIPDKTQLIANKLK
jgi:arylsulfatase A-like enzyme